MADNPKKMEWDQVLDFDHAVYVEGYNDGYDGREHNGCMLHFVYGYENSHAGTYQRGFMQGSEDREYNRFGAKGVEHRRRYGCDCEDCEGSE